MKDYFHCERTGSPYSYTLELEGNQRHLCCVLLRVAACCCDAMRMLRVAICDSQNFEFNIVVVHEWGCSRGELMHKQMINNN